MSAAVRPVDRRSFGGRPPPPQQLRPPSHPPQPIRLEQVESGGWRVAFLRGGENCVQRGTRLPPSAQAPTAALRFAPDTFAKESAVPAIATALLSNPLRSFAIAPRLRRVGPSVASSAPRRETRNCVALSDSTTPTMVDHPPGINPPPGRAARMTLTTGRVARMNTLLRSRRSDDHPPVG